jgi:hypothetical protein
MRDLHIGTFVAGTVFLLAGLALLLDASGAFDVDLALLWPLVLIASGGALLIGVMTRRSPRGGGGSTTAG